MTETKECDHKLASGNSAWRYNRVLKMDVCQICKKRQASLSVHGGVSRNKKAWSG